MPGYRVLTPLVRAGSRRLIAGGSRLGAARSQSREQLPIVVVGAAQRVPSRVDSIICRNPACVSARRASRGERPGRACCNFPRQARARSRARRIRSQRASCCWMPIAGRLRARLATRDSGSDPSVTWLRGPVVRVCAATARDLRCAQLRTCSASDAKVVDLMNAARPVRHAAVDAVAAARGAVLRAARRSHSGCITARRTGGPRAVRNQGDLIDPAACRCRRSRCCDADGEPGAGASCTASGR